MMIFKRKRRKDDLTEHAPSGTLNEVSDSGWINTELFMEYIKHFSKHAKPTKTDPVLLILDGHKSHTKNIELIEYVRDNGIQILSLPPHTSHKLQPLDRTFFKPLKVAFNTACTSWMRLHPARRISIDKIGGLFNTAYLKAATIENAVNGFRCTGIVPLNQSILPETEFLSDPREVVISEEPVETDPTTAPTVESGESVKSVNAINLQSVESVTDTSTILEKVIDPSFNSTIDMTIDVTPGPSNISFNDILKVPDIVEKKKSKRSEESEIITSSPYKKLLEKSIAESKTPKTTTKRSNDKKVKSKKTTVNKSKCKVKKNKLKTMLKTMSSEDSECLICGDWWHDSLPGEKWIQCSKCSTWLHELCCSSDSSVCDIELCYQCVVIIRG